MKAIDNQIQISKNVPILASISKKQKWKETLKYCLTISPYDQKHWGYTNLPPNDVSRWTYQQSLQTTVYTLIGLSRVSASFFRYLYCEVGRNYHWWSDLGWTDEQIHAYLSKPSISGAILCRRNRWLLRAASKRRWLVEIVFFSAN